MSQYIRYPANNYLNSVILYGSTSGQITLIAPAVVTSYTLTFPATQGGVNTFLKNDGSGGLTWAVGSGSSGFSSIGSFDAGSVSIDGLNATGTTLFAQSADATNPGMVNTGAQTFAGDKTFTGHIINSALTASRVMVTSGGSILTTAATTATEIGYVKDVTSAIQTQLNSKQATLTIGDLTDAGTDGIVVTGGVGSIIGSGVSLAQHVADATHNGYLNSADWSIFNGKQGSGNYITGLTGDVTAAGPGSVAATLATVNSNVGTFASSTVNGKGLVTAAANLSGDATTSGAALTLATVNGNVGSFGSSTSIPSFTVNAKGLVTAASGNVVVAPAGTLTGTTLAANVVTSSLTSVGTITSGTWTGTTIALANGGTGQTTKAPAFDALSPMTTGGDLIYGGTSGTGTRLANGSSGQYLKSAGGTSAPAWTTFTKPTVQVLSGTGTYTTPAGAVYIIVEAAGGGGGGAGEGTGGTGGNGTDGVTTTFGSSFITCNGGVGGVFLGGSGGAGGTATVVGAAPLLFVDGGSGSAGTGINVGPGGAGGNSVFGGGGGGGKNTSAGQPGIAKTGGGGGGGGGGATFFGGAGGGSGGYAKVLITSVSGTYAYAVGTGGAGHAAGTGGTAGGNGGDGTIFVMEFYQ